MQILEQLLINFENFPHRNAFYIDDTYYSYEEFQFEIARIQGLIRETIPEHVKYVGIFTEDDLQSYASIFALWFCGKAYVPLNPEYPLDRVRNIVGQTEIQYTLASEKNAEKNRCWFPGLEFISTGGACKDPRIVLDDSLDMNSDCYLLFTSGSTGIPKGVPVTFASLKAFISAFIGLYTLNEEDRFLQIYDLSFDASIPCFVTSLMVGGCLYTVPQNTVKYLYAYKLMLRKELTFVKMPPSTLAYLKPYFKKIKLDHLRYCLLGGEAVSAPLVQEWHHCAPNATIHNCYGPTEITVNSHIFEWKGQAEELKNYNDIVSIGSCIGDNLAVIINQDMEIIENSEKGELCLSGIQLTRGYWRNDDLNKRAFFTKKIGGHSHRFYRTGDIVFKDDQGDFMYVGRLDSQVQVQGFRVELGEIEKQARRYLDNANIAVIAEVNKYSSLTELFLFVEGFEGNVVDIKNYMESRLPSYMVPKHIINLTCLPKSVGGKINSSELKKIARNVLNT